METQQTITINSSSQKENPFITVLHQHASTLKGILLVQDTYSVRLIIHRRNPPGKMTRRTFHNALVSMLEQEVLDCDMDRAAAEAAEAHHEPGALGNPAGTRVLGGRRAQ